MSQYVLPLNRGSDWYYEWDITDNVNNVPWVWQVGDIVRGQVRSGDTLLHTWSRGNADVVTNTNGVLGLIIESSVSEPWTNTRAVADVEIVRPGNPIGLRTARPISIVLEITADITV